MKPDLSLKWHSFADAGYNSQIGPVYSAYTADPEHTWFARLNLEARHLNMGGVCHGGVMMSVADIAMGSGSWHSGGQHQCATIQMDSQFLAAAKEGQTLLAVANQSRRTKDLSFMSCTVWGGDREVFRASGVWKYLSRGSPRKDPIT